MGMNPMSKQYRGAPQDRSIECTADQRKYLINKDKVLKHLERLVTTNSLKSVQQLVQSFGTADIDGDLVKADFQKSIARHFERKLSGHQVTVYAIQNALVEGINEFNKMCETQYLNLATQFKKEMEGAARQNSTVTTEQTAQRQSAPQVSAKREVKVKEVFGLHRQSR